MTATGPNSVEAAGPSSSGSMLVFNQVRPDVGGAHWGGYDLQKEPFLFPIGQPRVTLAGTRATRFTLCPNPPTDAPAFQPLKTLARATHRGARAQRADSIAISPLVHAFVLPDRCCRH